MTFNNITIFGAGGTNIGHHILQALVQDGNYNITVLARASSTSIFPPAVAVTEVANFDDHHELVRALNGQDVLISCISHVGFGIQYKLVDAAIEAGVQRFFPSEYGPDNSDRKVQELCPPIFGAKGEFEKYLRSREGMGLTWTAVATSAWLDWFLDTKFLSIDPIEHTVRYWRAGTHAFSCTTLPYAAAAVLQTLRNPASTVNQRVFVSAFEASQRQIVSKLEKQQGVKYTVLPFDADEAVEQAKAKWLAEGNMSTMATTIPAAVMLPEYGANFVAAGKGPMLEGMEGVQSPELTLKGVVGKWVAAHHEDGV